MPILFQDPNFTCPKDKPNCDICDSGVIIDLKNSPNTITTDFRLYCTSMNN